MHFANKNLFWSVVALSLFSFNFALASKSDFDNILFDLTLDELMKLTITGSTLHPELITTVPAAVTVYSHEQINRMGVDYLHELIAMVPGHQVRRGESGGISYTYSARDPSSTSFARKIVLLIDGRLINDPNSGASNYTLKLIPVEFIERVEFVRGPGSVIHGANAFTSVINITSRKDQNKLSVGLGSNSLKEASLFANKRWEGGQFDIFAYTEDDPGQDYTVLNPLGEGSISTTDPKRFTHIDASLNSGPWTFQAMYHESLADNFYTAVSIADNFNKDTSQGYQLNAVFEPALSGNWETRVTAGYRLAWNEFRSQITPQGAFAPISNPSSNDPVQASVKAESRFFQLKSDTAWYQSDISNLRFGLEWKHEEQTKATAHSNYNLEQLINGQLPIDSSEGLNISFPIGREESQYLLGGYGQYQYRFNSNWNMTLGLRYDYFNRFGGRITPRLGLVKTLQNQNTIKLMYGEAYQVPSFFETSYTNNPVFVGNANLDYETIRTFDLIWLKQWDQAYLSMGWFYNIVNDPIIRKQVGTTRRLTNGPQEISHGFEVELKAQIGESWMISSNVTHLSKLPSSDYLESDWMGTFMVNYQRASWNWHIATTYTGGRQMLSPEGGFIDISDYWVTQSKFIYSFNKEWSLSLQAKNLFDETYKSPAEGDELPEGIINRGRELSATVYFDF